MMAIGRTTRWMVLEYCIMGMETKHMKATGRMIISMEKEYFTMMMLSSWLIPLITLISIILRTIGLGMKVYSWMTINMEKAFFIWLIMRSMWVSLNKIKSMGQENIIWRMVKSYKESGKTISSSNDLYYINNI